MKKVKVMFECMDDLKNVGDSKLVYYDRIGDCFITSILRHNGFDVVAETGVRRGDDFFVFQHNRMKNYKAVQVIKKCLRKGLSNERIAAILDRLGI